MEFKLLRVVEVLIAAIGGALVGFTYGMTDMYNKTMDGLGLIEGGTLGGLDMSTLYHVERLMSSTFPASKANVFGVAGLVIVLVSILIALFVPIRKVDRSGKIGFLVSKDVVLSRILERQSSVHST